MRAVAGAVEGYGTGVGQRGRDIIGGVRAIEVAFGAVDDERRLGDAGEATPEILVDEGCPQRADCGGIVLCEILAGPADAVRTPVRVRRCEDGLAGRGREGREKTGRTA